MAVLQFTPDEIRITAENKFDDGIYQLLYGVWKETSGEYDPKDDKPIVDPRGNTTTKNETKFKYWAMEQYGMTAEEYRGHTLDGTLKTLGEIDIATSKVMMILALPSMIKNAVKTVKDVAENGVPFDTSIGFAAGKDKIEETMDNTIKEKSKETIVENSVKSMSKESKRQTPDQKALRDLAKEAEKSAKKGNPISEKEARILDDWADEYDVPQHHKAYPGSGEHFKGGNYSDHTHIYNIHVPYK